MVTTLKLMSVSDKIAHDKGKTISNHVSSAIRGDAIGRANTQTAFNVAGIRFM